MNSVVAVAIDFSNDVDSLIAVSGHNGSLQGVERPLWPLTLLLSLRTQVMHELEPITPLNQILLELDLHVEELTRRQNLARNKVEATVHRVTREHLRRSIVHIERAIIASVPFER